MATEMITASFVIITEPCILVVYLCDCLAHLPVVLSGYTAQLHWIGWASKQTNKHLQSRKVGEGTANTIKTPARES